MPTPTKNPLPAVPKPPLPEKTILPKVWVTKYALTRGVLTSENAVLKERGSHIQVEYPSHRGYAVPQCLFKPDWHETEEEARAQVRKMVAAAKKSLKKKEAKLDGILDSVCGEIPTKPFGI